MDSLTQVVLGAAVGEAVLGKQVGYRAMMWGAIAGTIPDLDVFVRFFTDHITAREMHRGISHSLLFSIVAAFPLGWMANKIHLKRNAGIARWRWLFFWALVTHPLLDAHTVWGTQFFWPFDLRIAYKTIFVVDPLYTVPFLVLTLIALFHRKDHPRRRKFNNAGLIISSSYLLLSVVLKGITYHKFESELEQQKISYVEMDTRPMPLSTILWNAQVETKTGFRIAYYSFFDAHPIRFSEEIPKNHALLKPYRDQKVVQQLIHIAQGWYYVEQSGKDLIFTDIRFGQMGIEKTAPFLWRYKLHIDDTGMVTAERLRDAIPMSKALSELNARMWGE